MKGQNFCGKIVCFPPLEMLLSRIFLFLLENQNQPSNTWILVKLLTLFPFPFEGVFLGEQVHCGYWRPLSVCHTVSLSHFASKPASSLTVSAEVQPALSWSITLCHAFVSTFTSFIKWFTVKWPWVIPLACDKDQRIIGRFSYLKIKSHRRA